MKTKRQSRIIAFLLVLCLCLTMMPGTVIAQESETPTAAKREVTLADVLAGFADLSDLENPLEADTVPEIIGYEEALGKYHAKRVYADEGNELNKVVFENLDGTKTMYLFDFPVKYIDNKGKIQDISLEIKDGSSGTFETAGNSVVTTFSAQASSGISLSGNGTNITLVPIMPTVSQGTQTMTAGSTGGSLGSISSDEQVVSHAATRIDEKTIQYRYDSKTTIEYSLTYTGFKEDIVVSEYTGQTEYGFILRTGGYALEEIDGSYFLVDDAGKIKATVGDIIIFTADERNNTMGQLVPTTIVENEEYLLNIVVDPEFLADENTAYPIRIDPTVEINYDNNGAGAIQDATVYTDDTTNGSLGSIFVGLKQNGGIARILMKFPGLDFDTMGEGVEILDARVTLRDLLCESTALDVFCHVYAGATWDESTVCWDNTIAVSPDYLSDYLDFETISYSIGATLSEPHRYSFDITDAVQGWLDGDYEQDKGIVFKALDSVENGTSYNWKTMGSYNRASYKPTISVTYSEWVTGISISPTSATISVGTTRTLTATVLPAFANNQSVSWTSSNSTVASVSETGVVTGVGPGVATISCISNDSGVRATCTITVTPISYTTMTDGSVYGGTLSIGKHFWFQFTPPETGYYMFMSSSLNATDVRGYLFNGSSELISNDDGAGNFQFKICYKLIAGTTYRLRVQGYSTSTTGDFTVRVCEAWPVVNEPTINSRSEWGASDVITSRLVPRTREPARIIFHHSADKFSNTDIEACKAEIKEIQNDHMISRGKCDIAYHFIIDPAGRIWQGAEIDDYQRGHADNYFDDIGVVVLGDFESRFENWGNPNTLNDAQKNAMIELAKWLCYEYELPVEITNGPITTHRQVNSTECPGDNMAPWVESNLLNTILTWRE